MPAVRVVAERLLAITREVLAWAWAFVRGIFEVSAAISLRKVIRNLEPDQISTVDAESYQRNGPRFRKGLKKIG